MAVVLLEVVLPGAGRQGMPRQDRRLGRGHRGVRWRHAAGPIVPLQDHRGPSPQPLQVLHMSGTPHFSTHTTTNDRTQRSSELRGARRHRAAPTRYPRSTGWTRRTAKGNKVPSLVSELGDTILTYFRPRHTSNTSDLLYNYPILPIHASRDHGPATDRLCRHSRTLT